MLDEVNNYPQDKYNSDFTLIKHSSRTIKHQRMQIIQTRLGFFNNVEKLIVTGTDFNLLIVSMINHDLLNKEIGYLNTENLVCYTAEWLINVMLSFVDSSQFQMAKIESYSFAILIDPKLPKDALASLHNKLSGSGNKVDEESLAFSPPYGALYSIINEEFPVSGKTLNEIFNSIKCSRTYQMPNDHVCEYTFSLRELENAISLNELELWFQPKVCLVTSKVIGVEGLIRWRHSRAGVLLPIKFLDWFKIHGLMDQLNAWVINEGYKKATEFISLGHSDISVAINLDATYLTSPMTSLAILEAESKYNVPPENIEFEMLETVAIKEGDAAFKALVILRNKGHSISIDDFGTGQNNIAYLTFLPANIIKLDRLFSSSVNNESPCTFAKSAVDMAKSTDRVVVAEGIETEEQLIKMAFIGCDIGQGWYFGLPQKDYKIEHKALFFEGDF